MRFTSAVWTRIEGSKNKSTEADQKSKTAIIGMREREERVKAMVIKDGKGDTLKKVIRENVEFGSTLFTDEIWGCVHLGDKYDSE